MNSLKNRLQVLGALLLLCAAVLMVWYLLFRIPARFDSPDGTLVKVTDGKLVSM